MELLLPLSILVPLAAGIALLFAGRLGIGAVRALAVTGFALPCVAALVLWTQFDPALGHLYQFEFGPVATGLENLGIALHLGLNGISLPLYILAGVVGLAAGLYAMQSPAERIHLYLGLLLIMQAGLMGVFASVDVFFFYFFHELALIPTFIMTGIWGGRERFYAAMKMAVYLTVGAMLSLAGLILIYVRSEAPSFDIVTLRDTLALRPLAETVQVHAFGLLLFGFGILVSLWPFHTWAPLGYGAAPTANAMLHAGVLKKFGIYGFIQIAVPLLPAGAQAWALPLAWLALANVVIIGFVTIAQRDLKMMIGYSSVMHMGYCFLGVACLSVLGAGGTVILMVAHGLSVALLFLLATSIHHRTKTWDLEDMGGLVTRAPVLALFFATAILASIGLPGPGLANFWGELTIFMALYDAQTWMVVPAALGVVISAVYGLRALAKVFYGKPTPAFEAVAAKHTIEDMRWSEKAPALLLALVLVFLGVWPRSVTDGANRALIDILPDHGAAAASSEIVETAAPAQRPTS
jgi:NADH-quinone oxidoreductase subunit M